MSDVFSIFNFHIPAPTGLYANNERNIEFAHAELDMLFVTTTPFSLIKETVTLEFAKNVTPKFEAASTH